MKTLMLVLTLLLSTAWVLAQDSSQSAPSGSSSGSSAASQSSSAGAGGQTAVEGCLQGSSGSYTLTDKSGTTYTLQGDTSKLAEHVGHEVQITGSTSGGAMGSPSGSSASAGSSAGGGQVLTVDKVKHMSKTCKEGAK